MTIDELITLLGEIAEDLGDDVEVRLLFQPNWPLQYEIKGVALGDEEGNAVESPEDQPKLVVFLVEGGHPSRTPYASDKLWDNVQS